MKVYASVCIALASLLLDACAARAQSYSMTCQINASTITVGGTPVSSINPSGTFTTTAPYVPIQIEMQLWKLDPNTGTFVNTNQTQTLTLPQSPLSGNWTGNAFSTNIGQNETYKVKARLKVRNQTNGMYEWTNWLDSNEATTPQPP